MRIINPKLRYSQLHVFACSKCHRTLFHYPVYSISRHTLISSRGDNAVDDTI
jgi:hypothetical protein